MATFGGSWTQQKLEILRRYLDAYSTALKNTRFHLFYVDAFAGEGFRRPDSNYIGDDYGEFGDLLRGSARIALDIDDKPFDSFLFIEKDLARSVTLQSLSDEARYFSRDIKVSNEDANIALPDFCQRMGDFDRAVVFLDPYATQVSWSTVAAIAGTGKIDCWILFPLSAIARMMPRQNEPTEQLAIQLDRIFGGREYWEDFYRESMQQPLPLFAEETLVERPGGSALIANRYRERLETVFYRVATTSRTLKNSKGSPLFELYFAASNPVGAPIAVDIADHLLENW